MPTLTVYDDLAPLVSRLPTYEHLRRGIPRMPTVAHRWHGEMEQIALTFADLGLTPRIFEGIAELYRAVAETPVGSERPETRDPARDLDATIAALDALRL